MHINFDHLYIVFQAWTHVECAVIKAADLALEIDVLHV